MSEFSHFNKEGRARMVDVGGKGITDRKAVATGKIFLNEETFNLVRTGGTKKGDVLHTAQIAGIMGAKKTWEIIPMCHPIMINGIDIDFKLDQHFCSIEILATVKCSGNTGVEMEALTAVNIAALTIYDMCKAVQKDMIISDIKLLNKTGGKSGEYKLNE